MPEYVEPGAGVVRGVGSVAVRGGGTRARVPRLLAVGGIVAMRVCCVYVCVCVCGCWLHAFVWKKNSMARAWEGSDQGRARAVRWRTQTNPPTSAVARAPTHSAATGITTGVGVR